MVLIFLCTNICYATVVAVTDENLNESLLEFVSSEANEENYNITVSNNVITVIVDDESYTLNYDLSNKPTFSFEIPIEKEMSYANFKEQTDNLILPMIGYIAVANIQGVEFEDSSAYFLMSYLGNATYKDKQTIKDSSDGINSYEWITERKDVTNTSCKLVSSLSVNFNADFSKLNGYSDQIGESFLNKDITKENADYAITLKVSQKCRIETIENITGHELSESGYEYNEINENCAEITGKRVGKANGYIYVGETKKSIFITVEENTESTPLDTITLKINTTSVTDKSDESDNKQEEKTNANSNNKNTISKTTLPKAGVNNIVCIVMLFSLVLIIIFSIKLKKYEDIK